MNSMLRKAGLTALLVIVSTIAAHAQQFSPGQVKWPTGATGCVYAPGSNTCVPPGAVPLNGSVQTGNYTVTTASFVQMNCSSACTVTLPATVTTGFSVGIERIGAGTVTINPNGVTYDGATSIPLQYEFLTVWTDGTGYHSNSPLNVDATINVTPGPTQNLFSVAAGASSAICSDTSGSSTAQSCTIASFTLSAPKCFTYSTTTANAGASLTLNVNGGGAKPVAKWLGTTTLAAGDVPANKAETACYDGTNINLMTVGNAPTGGSGGGITTPGGCSVSSANDICLNDVTYNASPEGSSATSTAGTNAPSASITLVALGCIGAKFDATSAGAHYGHQGVLIAGAGVSSANYIGTVSSCSGSAMVVTPATSTSVSSGAIVQHDETAAQLAGVTAIQALPVPQGTILENPTNAATAAAVYLVNGPLQDTSGANAIVPMPKVPNYSTQPTKIVFDGLQQPPGIQTSTPGGTVIKTSLNSGNLFGGYDSASGVVPYAFTNVDASFRNLTIIGPSNPCATMINGQFLLTLQVEHVVIDGDAGVPTCSTGTGIVFPRAGNNVGLVADDIYISGFYTGAVFGEHTRIGSVYEANNVNGFVFDAQGTQGNGISAQNLWCQLCTNMIVGGSYPTMINVQLANAEVITGYFCKDPSNNLYGDVGYHNPYNDIRSPSTVTTPAVSGCANLRIHDLDTGKCFGILCPAAASPPVSGMVEFWPSQEGQGAVLANSGIDLSNAASSTNVTWSSATGFPGNVATYNGSSSFSAGASATNTAFDGTLPFSACAWINMSSLANTDNTIASNWNTSGWDLEVLGTGSGASGKVSVYLSNSYPSNVIHVVGNGTGSSTIATGALNHVCFTYDGSKSQAGVAIYVNGASQVTTNDHNSLTASIASATAVNLGRIPQSTPVNWFAGAIGNVSIWNRKLSAADVSVLYQAGVNGF